MSRRSGVDLRPGLVATGVAAAIMLAAGFYGARVVGLDTQVPMAWNVRGDVIRYGSPSKLFFFGPFLAVGVSILIAVLARNAQGGASARPMNIVWGAMLVFITALQLSTIWGGLGHPIPWARLSAFSLGLTYLAVAYAVRGMDINYFMGIRNRWTLSSAYAWQRTHRFGAWCYPVLGVTILLSGFYGSLIGLTIAVAFGQLVILSSLASYSYFAWNRAPDRERATE